MQLIFYGFCSCNRRFDFNWYFESPSTYVGFKYIMFAKLLFYYFILKRIKKSWNGLKIARIPNIVNVITYLLLGNFNCFTQFVRILDKRGQVNDFYTDLSKAFDIIEHTILFSKLEAFGFLRSAIRLLDRSAEYILQKRVPQGSNLGPSLFNIFTNDLLACFTCPVLAYSNDIKLYVSLSSNYDLILLQENLNKFAIQSTSNRLNLIFKKCCVVSFAHIQLPNYPNWFIKLIVFL